MSSRDGLSRALLMATLAVSALGIGALHASVLVGCSMMATAAALLVLSTSAPGVDYRPAFVPLGLSVYTLLQATPVPRHLLRLVAPRNADVWAYAMAPFGEKASEWVTLSADPGATLLEALKWATYAAVLVAAIAAGRRRGATWAAHVVFGVAVAVAAVTFVHGLLGATRVYGVYTPTFAAARWRVGPLLNPNNLSGYLNVGLLCGIGAITSRRPLLPRVVLGLGNAILLAVVFISASRAGLAAAVCGMLAFMYLERRIRRAAGGSRRDSRVAFSLAAVLVGGVVFAWLGATRETIQALLDKNIEKLEVLARTKPLLLDHPWLGIGRGAFESVFPKYHVGSQNLIYAHAENFAVQWVAEWGIPVGLAALVAFFWMLHPRRLGAERGLTSAGIWAALLALVLQNFLDLAFEIPAIAILIAVCTGVAWGDATRTNTPATHEDSNDASVARARNVWLWAVGAAAVTLAVMVLALSRHNVGQDRRRIRAALASADLQNPDDVRLVRDELHAAMLRHPAEPYFPRVGGLVAFRAADQSPVPWIQRALERGPHIGSTHLTIAHILASRHARKQALFELRLAVTYQPGLSRSVASLTNFMVGNYGDVLRAVPDGPAGARVLYAIAVSRRTEGPGDIREQALADAITRAPDLLDARRLYAKDFIWSLSGQIVASKCDGERRSECMQLVQEQIRELFRRSSDPSVVMLLAEYWLSIGRAPDAERILAQECGKMPTGTREACAKLRLRAAVALGSLPLVAAAAKDVAAIGCAAGKACGDLFASLGRSMERVGDRASALSFYQRAVTEDAADARWMDIARVASALGDHRLAATAMERLSNRHPDSPDLRAQMLGEQRALLPGFVRP